MADKTQLVPLHNVASPIEQQHIKEALDASQTAISAISTVVSVSTWALAIIGIGVALIALWGWTTLKEAARERATKIANDRFDAYIETDEFKEMVKEKITKSVEDRWKNTFVVRSLVEEQRSPTDEKSPFPSPGGKKNDD